MSLTRIKATHYSTNESVTIEIKDGLIVSVQPTNDRTNLYVAPGFIDNQVNGYKGVGFYKNNLTGSDVKQVIRELYKQGVTTFLPTIITSPLDLVKKNLAILAKVNADREWGQSIPCFHLEGPYISEQDGYRGAHEKKWIRNPDWQEFNELNLAANGLIKQITLAPEKSGALEFIKKCVENNIIVGLGHLSADSQIIHQAVQNGALISTHLGNACANYIHRHNNPLWPQLANEKLMASLIADGFHLNRDEVKVFYKTKGVDKLLLISDMTEMAGLKAGVYDWENGKVEVTEDGRLILKGKNILAGASLPLHSGVSNIISYTNCSLTEAIHMVTKNPAKLLKLTDRGEIAVGKRADLVLFEFHKNKLIIKKTLIAGKTVFKA